MKAVIAALAANLGIAVAKFAAFLVTGSASMLAEAVYAQGRFGQALRLTEEAEALAGAGDVDAQAHWRATRAKLLARRGQFGARRVASLRGGAE